MSPPPRLASRLVTGLVALALACRADAPRPPGEAPAPAHAAAPPPADVEPAVPRTEPDDPTPTDPTPTDPTPTDPTPPDPAPPITASPPAEPAQSAAPGVNEPYRARPRARYWANRLEREGREVYRHRREIVAALRLRPGMVVADVGAGTGLFTIPIADAVGPSGRVFAVDLMPTFLAHIDARARKAGLGNVTPVQASAASPGLPEGAVDLVFLADSYHHIESPGPYVAALRAALRPGGELVLIDFERIPGKSDAWLIEHVRAGKETVLAELRAGGFEVIEELSLLRTNYFVRLRPRE